MHGHHLWLCIIDPHSQFLGSKSTKNLQQGVTVKTQLLCYVVKHHVLHVAKPSQQSAAHTYNRVDCSNAGTRKHGSGSFGDHGHVDDNSIAMAHPTSLEHTCKTRNLAQHDTMEQGASRAWLLAKEQWRVVHLLLQLGVGKGLRGVGDVAVMDERSLVTATSCDMHIQSLVASVHLPTFVCVPIQ